LDDGDKLELLVSGTPNANLEGFLNHTIHQILMSLEVPYCFYDASKTNYKSYVAARYDYNASLKRKRKPLTQLLDRITDWRIRYWAAYDRELIDALEKEELTVGDVIDGSEWLAVDLPPVSRYEELKADAMEVSLGLSSRQEICRKRGKRFDKVIEDLAKEQELASDSGVILSSGLQPGGASVNEIIEKLEELEDNKGDS